MVATCLCTRGGQLDPRNKRTSRAWHPVTCVIPIYFVLSISFVKESIYLTLPIPPLSKTKNDYSENSSVVSLKTSPDQEHMEKRIRVGIWIRCLWNQLNKSCRPHDFSGFPALCNTEGEHTNAGTDYSKPLRFSSSRSSSAGTTPSLQSKRRPHPHPRRMSALLTAKNLPSWAIFPCK